MYEGSHALPTNSRNNRLQSQNEWHMISCLFWILAPFILWSIKVYIHKDSGLGVGNKQSRAKLIPFYCDSFTHQKHSELLYVIMWKQWYTITTYFRFSRRAEQTNSTDTRIWPKVQWQRIYEWNISDYIDLSSHIKGLLRYSRLPPKRNVILIAGLTNQIEHAQGVEHMLCD